MINVDLSNVQEAGSDFARPIPGGYVAMIIQVDLEAEKQYIRLYLDIMEGEFAHYYEQAYDRLEFWALTNIRSFKPKALPFFKQMTTAVAESNPGWEWTGDEQGLVEKYVGIILKNEQYTKNDGTLGMRLVVDRFTSVDKIRKGDFEVPTTKYIESNGNASFKASKADGIQTSNGRLSGSNIMKEGFMKVSEDNVEGIPFK